MIELDKAIAFLMNDSLKSVILALFLGGIQLAHAQCDSEILPFTRIISRPDATILVVRHEVKPYFQDTFFSYADTVCFVRNSSSNLKVLADFDEGVTIIAYRDTNYVIMRSRQRIDMHPYGWDSLRRQGTTGERMVRAVTSNEGWFLDEFSNCSNHQSTFDTVIDGIQCRAFGVTEDGGADSNSEVVNSRSVTLIFSRLDSTLIAYSEVFTGFGDRQVRNVRILSQRTVSVRECEARANAVIDESQRAFGIPPVIDSETPPQVAGIADRVGELIDPDVLEGLVGTSADLDSARVLVLDFWYVSCYPCRKSIPSLVRLRSDLDSSRYPIIGINPFDSVGNRFVEQLRESFSINYPLHFVPNSRAKELGVRAYPTLVVVEMPSRRVLQVFEGFSPEVEDQIRAVVIGDIEKR